MAACLASATDGRSFHTRDGPRQYVICTYAVEDDAAPAVDAVLVVPTVHDAFVDTLAADDDTDDGAREDVEDDGHEFVDDEDEFDTF